MIGAVVCALFRARVGLNGQAHALRDRFHDIRTQESQQGTAARRQASAEVAAWVEGYEPRSVLGPLWYGQLRDFVMPAVAAISSIEVAA